jgi:hypothetical protein
MDGVLLAPRQRREAFALGFGQKLGAPRLERRLQPDVQFHISSIHRAGRASPRLRVQ